MVRFVLRLVGALLAEKICERIRPVQWEFVPLEQPDGWLTYYAPAIGKVQCPTFVNSGPLIDGDLPAFRVPVSTDLNWKDK